MGFALPDTLLEECIHLRVRDCAFHTVFMKGFYPENENWILWISKTSTTETPSHGVLKLVFHVQPPQGPCQCLRVSVVRLWVFCK